MRVSDQPPLDEVVDLTKRLPCVPEVEVAFPSRRLPVDPFDHFRQRLETVMMICQFSNPFPFFLQRPCRWSQVQVSVSSSKQVSFVSEGEAKKVQLLPFFPEIDDASLLAVNRQAHSPFNKAFDVLSQPRRLVARQDDM